jgi:hypothetical protein
MTPGPIPASGCREMENERSERRANRDALRMAMRPQMARQEADAIEKDGSRQLTQQTGVLPRLSLKRDGLLPCSLVGGPLYPLAPQEKPSRPARLHVRAQSLWLGMRICERDAAIRPNQIHGGTQ